MNIMSIRSDRIYEKIMRAPEDKKADIYRYDLMKPFEAKWTCMNVPIKASQPNGYDVVMATDMLGMLNPISIDENHKEDIKLISDDKLWDSCEQTIRESFNRFTVLDFSFPVQDFLFSILLANPESPYIKMADGYAGDGSIPGYIFVSLVPNKYTLSRINTALAHECNHQVRFMFEKWKNDVNVGEYLIIEGLAENFATDMYGEDNVGPWVSKTDMDTLDNHIKPVIKDGLEVTGFAEVSSYMFGDEIAEIQGYFPVGLPYCAGYACGYYLIKHYLKKTGKTIEQATLTPSAEILNHTEDFWE